MKKKPIHQHSNKYIVFFIFLSIFFIIFIPFFWSLGYAYKLYGEHVWPGVALYAHISLIFLFFIFYLKIKKIKSSDPLFFYFFFIFLLLLFIYDLSYLSFSNDSYSLIAFNESFISKIYIIAYFIIGFYIFTKSLNSYLLYIMLALYLGVFLFEYNDGATIPVSLYSIYGDFSENIINYQLVSFSVVILSILILNSDLRYKYLFFFICVFMVFSSGGRSEFFGLVISFLFCLIYINIVSIVRNLKLKKSSVYLITISIIAPVVFFSFIQEPKKLSFNNRNFEIFSLKKSSSWNERAIIKDININNIAENPVLGAYGSHLKLGKGNYIHDIYSAWQQYGIFGFLGFILIISYPLIRLLFLYYKTQKKYILLPLGCSLYCFILLMYSKPIYWPVLGFSAGVYMFIAFKLNILNKDNI
ncbi:O-antigen polymerase [Xenorhabdus budapestensis]|uniref:O-antigen polymerase n=1 Tax=Xenorhabdus budapestensis TaxID=290110 RepID=A0A2D0IWR9_XENBU|nr:O-antigen polymerase [Xenorhabdus budapestensis]PHM26218.1 hypothetical protein Xbud_02686 [Xenorhabdus budapestensis]